MMYSSAIYDTTPVPIGAKDVGFVGSLEDAEYRKVKTLGVEKHHHLCCLHSHIQHPTHGKVDTLIARAQLLPSHRLLDIGFGWGGVAIRAAETIGENLHGPQTHI